MWYNANMSISEITKKSKKVFKKYHTAKAKSDVDILISFKKKVTLFDLADLREDLRKVLKKDVDIVSEKGVLPEFKKNIYSKLVSIYGER